MNPITNQIPNWIQIFANVLMASCLAEFHEYFFEYRIFGSNWIQGLFTIQIWILQNKMNSNSNSNPVLFCSIWFISTPSCYLLNTHITSLSKVGPSNRRQLPKYKKSFEEGRCCQPPTPNAKWTKKRKKKKKKWCTTPPIGFQSEK